LGKPVPTTNPRQHGSLATRQSLQPLLGWVGTLILTKHLKDPPLAAGTTMTYGDQSSRGLCGWIILRPPGPNMTPMSSQNLLAQTVTRVKRATAPLMTVIQTTIAIRMIQIPMTVTQMTVTQMSPLTRMTPQETTTSV